MANDKSIMHALKQLEPLNRIRTLEAAKGMDTDAISDVEVRLSALAKRHAATLCQNLDMAGENANWAESYFTTLICNQIADKWGESPAEAEAFDYASHLSALATEPMYAGLPSSWRETNAEVSFVATTVSAITRAMAAYNKFNLFHFDGEVIQNYFTETIITNATNAVTEVMNKLSEGPDTNSASSLLQSFIRQSGVLMSDIWQTASVEFIKLYELADESQKSTLKTPYSLELLADQHKRSLDTLAQNVIHSLAVSNELTSRFSMSN